MFNVGQVGFIKYEEQSPVAYVLLDHGVVKLCDSVSGWSISEKSASSDFIANGYKPNPDFPLAVLPGSVAFQEEHLYPAWGMYFIELFDNESPVSGILTPTKGNTVFDSTKISTNTPSGSSVSVTLGLITIDSAGNNYLQNYTSGYPGVSFNYSQTTPHLFSLTPETDETYIVVHSQDETPQNFPNSLVLYLNKVTGIAKFGYVNSQSQISWKYFGNQAEFSFKTNKTLCFVTDSVTKSKLIYLRTNGSPVQDGMPFEFPSIIQGISVPFGKATLSRPTNFELPFRIRKSYTELFNVPTYLYTSGSDTIQITGYFAPLYLEKRDSTKYRIYGIQYKQGTASTQDIFLFDGFVDKTGVQLEPFRVLLSFREQLLFDGFKSLYPIHGLRKHNWYVPASAGIAGGRCYLETDRFIYALAEFHSDIRMPDFAEEVQREGLLAFVFFKLDKQTGEKTVRTKIFSGSPSSGWFVTALATCPTILPNGTFVVPIGFNRIGLP